MQTINQSTQQWIPQDTPDLHTCARELETIKGRFETFQGEGLSAATDEAAWAELRKDTSATLDRLEQSLRAFSWIKMRQEQEKLKQQLLETDRRLAEIEQVDEQVDNDLVSLSNQHKQPLPLEEILKDPVRKPALERLLAYFQKLAEEEREEAAENPDTEESEDEDRRQWKADLLMLLDADGQRHGLETVEQAPELSEALMRLMADQLKRV